MCATEAARPATARPVNEPPLSCAEADNPLNAPSPYLRQAAVACGRTDAERLFALILPREGYRAGAAMWRPRDSGETALYNRLFETDVELARFLLKAAGRSNVWFSTATFKAAGEPAPYGGFHGRRDEANVHSRQCFHGDIDVGEDKSYLRFEHAKAALGLACARLALPSPIIVCSGHGLHFYFPLTEPLIDVRLWRTYATGLRAALEGHGLKLDATCSTDPVRLLRPPGISNHKSGNPLPVLVDGWGSGPVSLSAFDAFKERTRRSHKPRVSGTASIRRPLPLAEFPAVLKRCCQLNAFARKLGAVSEPEWKAALGVLAFVESGREIAHEYSRGDPRYDPAETDRKFDERCKLIGPTTCRHFQTLGNGLCATCTWRSTSLGEYAGVDYFWNFRLIRLRQAGDLVKARLLALWHRFLNNFNLGKVGGSKSDGALPGVVAAEAGDIARADLHRPYRQLSLDLNNFCRARVFHGGAQFLGKVAKFLQDCHQLRRQFLSSCFENGSQFSIIGAAIVCASVIGTIPVSAGECGRPKLAFFRELRSYSKAPFGYVMCGQRGNVIIAGDSRDIRMRFPGLNVVKKDSSDANINFEVRIQNHLCQGLAQLHHFDNLVFWVGRSIGVYDSWNEKLQRRCPALAVDDCGTSYINHAKSRRVAPFSMVGIINQSKNFLFSELTVCPKSMLDIPM